ncbi:MAG: hypothetical protein OXM61_12335 [Candidatus Poribacteria bacterium]|nr:hypothetical protein [Candidatus Poribacteria bacterium]
MNFSIVKSPYAMVKIIAYLRQKLKGNWQSAVGNHQSSVGGAVTKGIITIQGRRVLETRLTLTADGYSEKRT